MNNFYFSFELLNEILMAFSKIFKIFDSFPHCYNFCFPTEAKNNEITQTSIKFNKNMEENLVKIGIVLIIAATGLGIAKYLHQNNFSISKGVKSLKKVKALVSETIDNKYFANTRC